MVRNRHVQRQFARGEGSFPGSRDHRSDPRSTRAHRAIRHHKGGPALLSPVQTGRRARSRHGRARSARLTRCSSADRPTSLSTMRRVGARSFGWRPMVAIHSTSRGSMGPDRSPIRDRGQRSWCSDVPYVVEPVAGRVARFGILCPDVERLALIGPLQAAIIAGHHRPISRSLRAGGRR
jgi:hypothetical protein